jgi:hypothetical protein
MTRLWQKRDLEGADVGPPGPLPAQLARWTPSALANLQRTPVSWGLRGFYFVPYVAPAPVPPQIDLLWAELALQGAGLFEAYQAVVTAAAEADVTTRIIVARAQSWRRTDPTLVTMAAALGLTDADVDNLFRSAESLAKAAGVPVA